MGGISIIQHHLWPSSRHEFTKNHIKLNILVHLLARDPYGDRKVPGLGCSTISEPNCSQTHVKLLILGKWVEFYPGLKIADLQDIT